MEQIELAAARRSIEKNAAKRLRREGQVPAILYGHGVETEPLQIAAMELKRTLTQAGASQLIHLRVDNARATRPVLAREIQRDILSGEPIHVDFLAVSMTETITAEVSITLVGEPGPVTRGEALMLQGTNSIEIECLPGDLIPTLEVDVSKLTLDSAIYVGDLHVPDGIAVLSDPQELVAQIVVERMLAAEEEEVEELVLEEPAEVEVISRGKVKEEDED